MILSPRKVKCRVHKPPTYKMKRGQLSKLLTSFTFLTIMSFYLLVTAGGFEPPTLRVEI